jgi:hypothetical protein
MPRHHERSSPGLPALKFVSIPLSVIPALAITISTLPLGESVQARLKKLAWEDHEVTSKWT